MIESLCLPVRTTHRFYYVVCTLFASSWGSLVVSISQEFVFRTWIEKLVSGINHNDKKMEPEDQVYDSASDNQ